MSVKTMDYLFSLFGPGAADPAGEEQQQNDILFADEVVAAAGNQQLQQQQQQQQQQQYGALPIEPDPKRQRLDNDGFNFDGAGAIPNPIQNTGFQQSSFQSPQQQQQQQQVGNQQQNQIAMMPLQPDQQQSQPPQQQYFVASLPLPVLNAAGAGIGAPVQQQQQNQSAVAASVAQGLQQQAQQQVPAWAISAPPNQAFGAPSGVQQQQQQQSQLQQTQPVQAPPSSSPSAMAGAATVPTSMLAGVSGGMVVAPASNEFAAAAGGAAPSAAAPASEPAMTEQERLEQKKRKNAEQARRSREKKRNMEAHLRAEMRALQRENEHLKSIVKNHIPDNAQQIIGECCYKQHGKSHWNESSKLLQSDFELIEGLTKGRQAFVLTDPRMPDNPIVYTSTAFLEMTGYTQPEVLGRNCRFLQGVDTDHKAVKSIREAIEKGVDGAACILNYKSDGTPFWNHFFVAALRDGENRIVNYVGVQTEVDKPVHEQDDKHLKPQPVSKQALSSTHPQMKSKLSNSNLDLVPQKQPQQFLKPAPLPQQPSPAVASMPTNNNFNSDNDRVDDIDIIDWAELAQVLEADYQDKAAGVGQEDASAAGSSQGTMSLPGVETLDDREWDMTETTPATVQSEMATVREERQMTPQEEIAYLGPYFSRPREMITKTVRSELIDALLSSEGDVDDPRFLSALDVLSTAFKSNSGNTNYSLSSILNGSWRSLSRPSYHYGGCLGMNERGSFVYTLGRMCFNMFKPSSLRCTVQSTMNIIQPVCVMDNNAPRAAPWSLRRELALVRDDPNEPHVQPNTMLKSYDIVIALTIEPGQFKAAKNETIPSPPCRVRATHVVRGYFLPDPEVPNRLTVWFTGGELAPAPPPPGGKHATPAEVPFGEERFGGMNDWMSLFGVAHKRSWGESISLMGAKLFLGAELPDGMGRDGSMRYMLHRPYGGHGKGYVDVVYADSELLITKGNSGTLHVMTQKPQASSASPQTDQQKPPPITSS